MSPGPPKGDSPCKHGSFLCPTASGRWRCSGRRSSCDGPCASMLLYVCPLSFREGKGVAKAKYEACHAHTQAQLFYTNTEVRAEKRDVTILEYTRGYESVLSFRRPSANVPCGESATDEIIDVDTAQAPRVPSSSGHAKTPLYAYKAHAERHWLRPFVQGRC